MAICRWGLGGVLDAGDEIGRVDALWLLRIFDSVEFEKYPRIFMSTTQQSQNQAQNLLLGSVRVNLERTAQ
jgi:hypothetical protein